MTLETLINCPLNLDENLIGFFDTIPVPMLLSRTDGSFEYVNPALARLLGYSLDEIYADDVIITHPDDFPINRSIRERLNADPFLPVVTEKRYRHKDGRSVAGMLTIVAQPDGEGMVRRFIAQILDLTALKQAENATRQAEQRFRTMFGKAPLGMALYDARNGSIYDANAKYLAIVDRSMDELRQGGWMRMTHPEDMLETQANIARLNAGAIDSFKLNKRYLRPDGSEVFVNLSCTLIEPGGGSSVPQLLVTIEDITEFKRAQEELLSAAMVYQQSSEAMMIFDARGFIVAVNPAFTARTGYPESELIGKTSQLLDSGRHGAAFYQEIKQTIFDTGNWQGEIWARRKQGDVFPMWVSVNAVINDDGVLHRLISLSTDITDKKAAEQLIWKQANFDSLTGLPNRQMLRDRLNHEIGNAQRNSTQLALLNLDLDRFKDVNDSLGHDMGDLLLIEAAKRLTACVRSVDTVARQGGDEFTIIMGGLDGTASVERVIQALLSALSRPFQLGNETAYISTSIGITLYPRDATGVDVLTKNADQAMYAAKHKGRNCFCFFTPAMQQVALARLQIINDLRAVRAEEQFELHYQPIVDLSSGALQKAEALLRWRRSDGLMIDPGDFIRIAEETRMILDIGNWVFERAVADVQHLRERFCPELQVSINSSPVQFRDTGGHLAGWSRYLERGDIDGEAIVVEITEGLLMSPDDEVGVLLTELRRTGIQVSLDDFGTGYSSLSYLKRFEIDYLKIDRSFVSNLGRDPADGALCEAIIAMAHKLGIRVIAEGVETREQHELLSEAGCDLGQGYWYSRPLPLPAFENLLRDQGASADQG